MVRSFFVTFSESWITYFPSRIEVDDRTEAYLRVLQQKVTSDTQIVSSPSVRRQLSWSDLFTKGPLEILELEFISKYYNPVSRLGTGWIGFLDKAAGLLLAVSVAVAVAVAVCAGA